MQDELHIDYETRAEVNLKTVGLSRYARDRDTRLLMGAYSFNGGRVDQWDYARGEPTPREVKEALLDPHVIKIAWNAAFEIQITRQVMGLKTPIRSWRCAMVLALSLSMPAKLEIAGRVLKLDEDKAKMREGKSLVTFFTQPRKRATKTKTYRWNTHETDPKKWEKFLEYNRRDVIAESDIYDQMIEFDLPPEEWELWHIDQMINERGVPVNLNYVDNVLDIIDVLRGKRLRRMKEITGLENVESNDQLLPWLQDRGYQFNDLKKGHITRALEDWRDGDNRRYKEALAIRADIAKASLKKYVTYRNMTDSDGLYRFNVQFSGAGRTMRWAGRGVQLQNLARPAGWLEKSQETLARHLETLSPEDFETIYGPPLGQNCFEALATGVRPAIQAPEGYVFLDADLNAIENRVLGWMAMDRRILSVFENNRDPYIDFGQYMFKESYEFLMAEYKAGFKGRRQLAKPPVLGCGYMLGAGAQYEDEATGEIVATGLLGYAWNMGVKMKPEESEHAVTVWRKTFSDVVDFWYALMKAAMKCLRSGERTYCEVFEFDLKGPYMRMRLPSGRFIHYYKPKIEKRKTPWGEWRDTITYEQLNDKNQWVRVSTHPGKVTENGDQAIARDLLANGVRHAWREGLDIRLHVHDQIVVLAKEDKAEQQLKLLIDCMCRPAKWNRDLPLAAAGAISKVFIKD